ncbi:hypothetical protein EWM64_g7941 [Hericium alpestre]|uniref:Uncharacterized protein n=1 Tax=Hericium alpestre TaxID=135208 RepID=A0A4Y9ZP84_9AGAM|nr:hypothetical protein EWM64_g7941 [Hericium alpestre]
MANSDESNGEQWLRHIRQLQAYCNLDLGICAIHKIPSILVWDNPERQPAQLTISSSGQPLTMWIVGHIACASFTTPRGNHREHVHINICPLAMSDQVSARKLLRHVGYTMAIPGTSYVAATINQHFHVLGSHCGIFRPFDCAWDGRDGLMAKDYMPRYDACKLKENDMVLLELEVVKYKPTINTTYCTFHEGMKPWFELQHVILLQSAPGAAALPSNACPSDTTDITI